MYNENNASTTLLQLLLQFTYRNVLSEKSIISEVSGIHVYKLVCNQAPCVSFPAKPFSE